jgi:hypothetical protein
VRNVLRRQIEPKKPDRQKAYARIRERNEAPYRNSEHRGSRNAGSRTSGTVRRVVRPPPDRRLQQTIRLRGKESAEVEPPEPLRFLQRSLHPVGDGHGHRPLRHHQQRAQRPERAHARRLESGAASKPPTLASNSVGLTTGFKV